MLVVTFLGALEIMLDRGLEDDWFASKSKAAVWPSPAHDSVGDEFVATP